MRSLYDLCYVSVLATERDVVRAGFGLLHPKHRVARFRAARREFYRCLLRTHKRRQIQLDHASQVALGLVS